MKTIYEWCYETIVDGEVDGNDHEEKLSNFQDNRKTDTLVLVRDVFAEDGNLEDRLWAYVKDGKLPETFSDANQTPLGYNVPKRFHKELANYLKAQTV